jgi:hypothetical protein
MKTSKCRLTGRSRRFTRLLVAQMAELVDAPASGAGTRKGVEVRVLFWAPISFQNKALPCIESIIKSPVRRAFLLPFSRIARNLPVHAQPSSPRVRQPAITPSKGCFMEDTVAIETRSEFALWAIERAKEIVSQEGTALALAARDMDEEGLREAGHKLGGAISDALLEVFDGLLGDQG